MKMKMICTCTLAAMMLLASPLLGQTDAPGLETALHGKPLGLRSYSADSVAKFTWVGGKLVPETILLYGLGAFFTDTVRLKGSTILIEGQYSTLVLSGGKLAPMGKVPMRLEVELQGVSPATVIPQLQASLFFPSLKDTMDNLPDYVSDFLPFPVEGKFQSSCHCIHVLQDGKWNKLDAVTTKITPPAFIKMASNDSLNQMAIDAKVSGTITLIYMVAETGRIDEVWVAKPLDPGIDAAAAKLGRDNLLRPASLDGKPVGTVLIQTIPIN
jgi:hypothetical protein